MVDLIQKIIGCFAIGFAVVSFSFILYWNLMVINKKKNKMSIFKRIKRFAKKVKNISDESESSNMILLFDDEHCKLYRSDNKLLFSDKHELQQIDLMECSGRQTLQSKDEVYKLAVRPYKKTLSFSVNIYELIGTSTRYVQLNNGTFPFVSEKKKIIYSAIISIKQ
jgi:hypothetical protein